MAMGSIITIFSSSFRFFIIFSFWSNLYIIEEFLCPIFHSRSYPKVFPKMILNLYYLSGALSKNPRL